MKLSTLKKSAAHSANYRGHSLKWGMVYGRADGPKSQNAECKNCKAHVFIHEQTEPNSIRVSGLAVAINCKDGR